jgi:hypothetical protein
LIVSELSCSHKRECVRRMCFNLSCIHHRPCLCLYICKAVIIWRCGNIRIMFYALYGKAEFNKYSWLCKVLWTYVCFEEPCWILNESYILIRITSTNTSEFVTPGIMVCLDLQTYLCQIFRHDNNNGNIKFYFISILRYNLNLWNTGRRLQLWYKLEES